MTSTLERFFKINEALIAQGLMSEDVAVGGSFEELEVPSEWQHCADVCVTEEINDLYRFALRDNHPWYTGNSPFGPSLAHPIALVQLGTRPLLREFPVDVPDGESSLHAKMECRFSGPINVGVVYREEGRLAEKYIRRGRRYLVTEGRFLDESGVQVLCYRHTRMVGTEPA